MRADIQVFLDDKLGYAMASLCVNELLCDESHRFHERYPKAEGAYNLRETAQVLGVIVELAHEGLNFDIPDDGDCAYHHYGFMDFDYDFCVVFLDWITKRGNIAAGEMVIYGNLYGELSHLNLELCAKSFVKWVKKTRAKEFQEYAA